MLCDIWAEKIADAAHTRVALGGVLHQVRDRLEHGEWLGWLEGTVPFTARSALNYIELSSWANANGAVFERVAPLGASKVYLLSKLPAAQLEQLLAKPDHLVPGAKQRTTLPLMKYGDFMKLLLQLSRPAAPPTDPMVALLADARSSAKKTIRLMKLLSAHKQALDHDAVEDLHDDLVVALQKLSSASSSTERPSSRVGCAHWRMVRRARPWVPGFRPRGRTRRATLPGSQWQGSRRREPRLM